MRFSAIKVLLIALLFLPCLAVADQGLRKAVKEKPVAYPEAARQAHLTGTVRLEIRIAPSGKVKKVDILGGNPILAAAAAADTVKDWEYEARPSETTQIVVVKFDQQ